MQKKRRFGMKNVIASVLTAALVLTSTPSGFFAGELLEVETEEEYSPSVEEIAETAPAEETADGALGLFGADDADEAMFSVSEDVEAVEAVTESDVAVEDNATETVTEAALDYTAETVEVSAEAELAIAGLVEGTVTKVVAKDVSVISGDAEVTVTITTTEEEKAALAEAESFTLVRVVDDVQAELVPAEKIVGEVTADGAQFAVDSSSVYAIVATVSTTVDNAETVLEETTETVENTERNIEEETDAEVEVEAASVASDVTTATVNGIRGWYYTYFTAELTGANVTVAVPSFFGTPVASMQACYVDASAYEELINAENYGKVASDLKAIEITFLNKRGKVVKAGTVSAEIEIASTAAETYVMYQQGRSAMKKVASADYPYFSFNINNGGTYVFAGLTADGVDRAEGITNRGITTFDLETSDGTGITATTAAKSFSGTMYMEAENAMTEDTILAATFAVENPKEVEVVQAVDISFHNEEGRETEPARDVTVTITTPLSTEGTYQLVHIKDNGETEIVENAFFDENGVTFTAGEFSTYALVWTEDAVEKQATITWGYLDGDTLKELEQGSTITLDTTAATVSLENSYEGYYMIGAEYRENSTSNWVDINPARLTKIDNGWQITTVTHNADDSTSTATVTVADGSEIRVIYGPLTTPVPSGAADDKVPSPKTEKTVTDNGDGTYTIQLDITGTQVTEIQQTGANVLMVLDTTYSMASSMTGATNRFEAARSAMLTLIDTLDCGTNDIDLALVEFNSVGSIKQNWTKDYTTLRNYIASTAQHATGPTGTNWESGLYYARQVLNDRDSDNTYVIFLTDGEPNRRGTTTSTNAGTTTAISYALSQAQAITALANTSLYGVFCGSASGYNNLNDMIRNAHGVKTINGTDSDTLKNEFKAIAQTIVDNLGANNVAVDDGVPSLAGISANVVGEAGGYEYYIKGKDDSSFTEWDDAPGAIYSNDNGVTWDLSSAGSLPAGTTYRIKFTVWPSQAAYDLIADLNNGLKEYDDLPDDQKAAVTGSKETGYTMVTNTHLNTTYTFKGTEYSDQPDLTSKAMPLPTKKISVVKIWPNQLDGYAPATYRDKDGNELTASEITLNLNKDNADYLPITVKAAEGWKKDDVYVSCGNMTVKNGVVTIHEPGHDYQITEPEAFSYYWDLISDVYHPMVINGTAYVLVLDDDATAADNVNTFQINGRFYTKQDNTENTLRASNYRRSNLNLTKVVSTKDGQDDYFTYTVTVTDANSTDGYVWFSAWDPSPEATVKDTDWVLSGATAQAGNTGYWYAQNGAAVTFKIKQGWNVRFLNLYHGSTFSIQETVTENYTLESIEATHSEDFMDETIGETWYTRNDSTPALITGTIVEPNNSYSIKYTNKSQYFYVYHSSDNSIERIRLSDARVVNGKFNIVNEVKSNYIYGGYYKAYSGAVKTDDEIRNLTYSKVTDTVSTEYIAYDQAVLHANGYWYNCGGTGYTGAPGVWNAVDAHTDKTSGVGNAMIPEAGKVYYLKEVPDTYLRSSQFQTFKVPTDELYEFYLVTAVDDANYREVGFVVREKEGSTTVEKTVAGDLYDQVKIEYPAPVVEDPDKVEEINIVDVNGYNDDGYIVMKKHDVTIGCRKNIRQYFITPDGVRVQGTVQRITEVTDTNSNGIIEQKTEIIIKNYTFSPKYDVNAAYLAEEFSEAITITNPKKKNTDDDNGDDDSSETGDNP